METENGAADEASQLGQELLPLKCKKENFSSASTGNLDSLVGIEEALEYSGFSFRHVLILSAVGLVLLSLFAQIEMIGLLATELLCEFNLSPVQEAFLTSAFFTGMIFGALLWGHLSDKYGRKRVIQLCSLFASITVLASSVTQSFTDTYLLRILVGMSMGGFHVCYTYATEIVGSTHRAKACLILFIFQYLGAVYGAAIGLITVTENNLGWRYYVLKSSLPIVLGLVSVTSICPESPRFLLVKGETDKATKVVKILSSKPNSDLKLASIMKSIGDIGSWKDLIATPSDKMLLGVLSSLIFLIRFFNIGVALLFYENLQNPYASDCNVLVETYKESGGCDRLKKNDYSLDILFSSSGIFGALFYYFLADYFGRRKAMARSLSFSTLCMSTFYFCMPNYSRTICSLVVKSFCFTTELVFNLYINEVYPTYSRSAASGFTDCFSRLGLALSPLISQYLAKESYPSSVSVYIASGVLGVVIIRSLKTETRAQLQDDVWKKAEKK